MSGPAATAPADEERAARAAHAIAAFRRLAAAATCLASVIPAPGGDARARPGGRLSRTGGR